MIKIYAMHFYQNGSIREQKTLIQEIPAKSEGRLYLIDPKVSTKIGNAESFDFSLQPDTKYYDCFIQLRTFFHVEYDGDLIFYGRVLTIENGLWGEQKIKCEGAFAFFNDSYYPGKKDSDRINQPLHDYLVDVLNNHNTQLNDPLRKIYPGEIPGQYTSATSADQKIENISGLFGENGWRQTKSVLDDLASNQGGMFRVRRGDDNKLYLDWYKHYYRSTINTNQPIAVGKNLIDVSRITEVNNIFTVVVPIGKGADSDNKLYISGTYFPVERVCEFYSDSELRSGYHLPEDYREARDTYGVIIKPQEFSNASNESELLRECAKWVKECYQGGIEEFTVTAVDLHQIEKDGENKYVKILSGDRNIIRYPIGQGKVKQRTLTCTSASFELYNPENNQYTFGIPASSLKNGNSINSTKTNKDVSSQPAPSYGGINMDEIELDPYKSWYKEKLDWLKSHRVWWKHLSADEKKRYSKGLGPNGDSNQSCFYHLINEKNSDGEYLAEIWVPIYDSTQNVGTESDPVYKYIWRMANGRPVGEWRKITRDSVNNYEYDLKKSHLFEYVYDEWGVNLGVDMPTTNIFSPTNLMNIDDVMKMVQDPETFENVINMGETVLNILNPSKLLGLDEVPEWANTVLEKLDFLGIRNSPIIGVVKEKIGGLGEKINGILGFDATGFLFGSATEGSSGFDLKSFFVNFLTGSASADGDVESKGDITASGNVNGTDLTFLADDGVTRVSAKDMKDIQIQLLDHGNKIGSIVTRYFTSDDPTKANIVTQEFTQSIEQYAGGPIVVARVEADQVLIGGVNADVVYQTALNNISHVCGEFTTVLDEETGRRNLVLKEGSGLFMTKDHTEYGVYHDGNLDSGVIVNKMKKATTAQKTEFQTSLGYYTDGNLDAGVMVRKFQDASAETKDTFQVELGYYTDGNLDSGVIANKMKTATTAQKTEIQTSLGYYTDGNLDAGVMVRKFQDASAETKDTFQVELGYFTDDTLDGGVLIRKINGNNIETNIIGDRILIGDKSGVFHSGYISDDKLNFYSDSKKTQEITKRSGHFYGDIPTNKVYIWKNNIFTETDKTLDLQTSSMMGIIGTKATFESVTALEARFSTLEAKNITTENLSAEFVKITDELQSWNARFGAVSSADYVIRAADQQGHESNRSLRNAFRDLQVVSDGPNTYKIQYMRFGSNTWEDFANATFNRASLLKGSWSGGTFTVREDSTGTTPPISTTISTRFGSASGSYFIEAFQPNISGQPSAPGTSINYTLAIDDLNSRNANVQICTLNGTKINNTYVLPLSSYWDAAQGAFKVKGSWSNTGVFTVRKDSTGSVPPISTTVRTRFNSNSGTYFIESFEQNSSGSPSISGTTTNYNLVLKNSNSRSANVQICNASNNKLANTPEILLSNYWDTAWNDGKTEGIETGYSNASSIVKVDGVSTLITNHTISAGSTMSITVPYVHNESSGVVMDVLTHNFTAEASSGSSPTWDSQGFVDSFDHLPSGTTHHLNQLPNKIKDYLNYNYGYIYFRIKIGSTYHVYYFAPITTS